MYPPEAFQALLEELARLLDARSVRFALTGGIVSAYYSEPRFTQDVDLVLNRDQLIGALDDLLGEFRRAGYLFDEDIVRQAVQQGRPFQLFHMAQALKLDLYPRELVPGELGRAVYAELYPGVMLPVIAPVDLAVSKLIWISKGSHKSRSDLRHLMRRMTEQEGIDVRQLANDRSLGRLLEEVLTEPDEIES